MGTRRQGTQLLNSIYHAVKAQLAADGGRLSALPGLRCNSPYAELFEPQQLTCLRQFSNSSSAFSSSSTTSVAEVNVHRSLLCFVEDKT